MTDSNWTLRFPRTTRCDGHAIYHYKPPLTRRFFYALCKWGRAIVPAVLAVSVLTGCVDMQTGEADAASLRDAVAQAKGVRNE